MRCEEQAPGHEQLLITRLPGNIPTDALYANRTMLIVSAFSLIYYIFIKIAGEEYNVSLPGTC